MGKLYSFVHLLLWREPGLDDSWPFWIGIPCHCKSFSIVQDGLQKSSEQTTRGWENNPHGHIETRANAAYWNRIKKSLKRAVTLSLVPSASCCTLLFWIWLSFLRALKFCCLEGHLCRTDVFFQLKGSFSLTSFPWHSIRREPWTSSCLPPQLWLTLLSFVYQNSSVWSICTVYIPSNSSWAMGYTL